MNRKYLSGIFALLFLLSLLSGCGRKEQPTTMGGVGTFGGEETDSSVEDSSQPDHQAGSKGIFSLPFNASYGWDPYACIGVENRAVMQLIYEGLFCMDPAFDPVPVLCSEYEVSDDGRTYTLHLRDAKFSDESILDASDVIYSMNKAAESEIYKGRFSDISSYEASGASTVTIYMKRPNDRLPCLMDFPIIPNNASTAAGPAGTGPFQKNGTSQLVSNKNWWKGSSTLNFSSITLYSSTSAEETRDRFETDQVHFVYNNPMSSVAATYHCDYELWNSPGTVMQFIGINSDSNMFNNATARSAITKALDRSAIAESVYHNFADPAVLPVHPASSMYYSDLVNKYNYNPSEAISMLMSSANFSLPKDSPFLKGDTSQAHRVIVVTGTGVPDDEDDPEPSPTPTPVIEEDEKGDGKKPEILYNQITMDVCSGNLYRVAAAKAAANCLTKVGFTVTLKVVGEDEFHFDIYNGLCELYYTDVYLRPDFNLTDLLTYGGDLNYSRLDLSNELEDLLYNSKENTGNRYELYDYVMEQGCLCPVLFQNYAVFTTRGVFTGLNPSPDNLFYNIENVKAY